MLRLRDGKHALSTLASASGSRISRRQLADYGFSRAAPANGRSARDIRSQSAAGRVRVLAPRPGLQSKPKVDLDDLVFPEELREYEPVEELSEPFDPRVTTPTWASLKPPLYPPEKTPSPATRPEGESTSKSATREPSSSTQAKQDPSSPTAPTANEPSSAQVTQEPPSSPTPATSDPSSARAAEDVSSSTAHPERQATSAQVIQEPPSSSTTHTAPQSTSAQVTQKPLSTIHDADDPSATRLVIEESTQVLESLHKGELTPLLCISYLPDGITAEQVEALLARFGRMANVHIGQTKVDRFFGRAYVRFNDVDAARKVLAEIRALEEPVSLHGEELLFEPVHLPEETSYKVFVGNLPTEVSGGEIWKSEMKELFGEVGQIHRIFYDQGQSFAHVSFMSKSDAQRVWLAHKMRPFELGGQQLFVEFAKHVPRSVLHVSRFVGSEDFVLSFFDRHRKNIEWIKLFACMPGKSEKPYNYAYVGFNSVENAQFAFESLKDSPVALLEYSARKIPKEWTKQPTPIQNSNLALRKIKSIMRKEAFSTCALHVSNIPKDTPVDAIEKLFHLGALGGATNVIPVYDNNGQFDGRALVAFEAAEDAAYAQESAEGFKMGNNALTVRTAMVPRLNKARPMLIVDNLVNTESDTQRELWDALAPIATIQRMTIGRTGKELIVEFADIQKATLAIERHALEPIKVNDRLVRMNFASIGDIVRDKARHGGSQGGARSGNAFRNSKPQKYR